MINFVLKCVDSKNNKYYYYQQYNKRGKCNSIHKKNASIKSQKYV